MARTDLNRVDSGIALPHEVSELVLGNLQQSSAVMQLARNIRIPGHGASVNVITSDPVPAWVDESDEKTVSTPELGSKQLIASKLAVIVPFSNEFRRDTDTLYDEIVARIPSALGAQFDKTVFGGVAAPSANFDQLTSATAVSIAANTYASLVTAKTNIATAGGEATGWVFAPQASPILLNTVDGAERPLFLNNLSEDGNVNRLLGIPAYYRQAAYKAGTPNTLGFVGDWNKAVVGMVDDIQIEYSDQATVNNGGTQINLWQRNMFALRAEIEIGFVIQDIDFFTKLTD